MIDRQASKPTLDKDLKKFTALERASGQLARTLLAPGLALVFLALAAVFASLYITGHHSSTLIVAAAVIGAYMALTIGANDVANNVGPALGARAITMTGALAIAAIFESAGALIAGGDVVGTIAKGIIDVEAVESPQVFIHAMLAALIASALWVHLATWLSAPVSTTHAIVGGVVGSGIAAAGFGAVHWDSMGEIAASWVISPLLGGLIAAAFLAFIKTFIIYQPDKIAAARRWVPVLIALMAGAFASYLALKGLSRLIAVSLPKALLIGALVCAGSYALARPLIARQSEGMENRNQSLRKLFRLPLIFSAALLSFAHGANDVANAIGPLAAIVHTAEAGNVAREVSVPLWVMVIGALGISVGLLLFGPRLIRMVGQQITKLNPMRAYCVALSAAITVIIASWLGLPVSSTHIAVGGVFGVGFFREWYTRHSRRRLSYVQAKPGTRQSARPIKRQPEDIAYRKLVRRSHLTTIIAAWIITVPAAAALSALTYLALSWLVR